MADHPAIAAGLASTNEHVEAIKETLTDLITLTVYCEAAPIQDLRRRAGVILSLIESMEEFAAVDWAGPVALPPAGRDEA